MSKRCVHPHWDPVSVTFNPATPATEESSRGPMSHDKRERLLVGFTAVAQRCSACGWIDTTNHTGKIELWPSVPTAPGDLQ